MPDIVIFTGATDISRSSVRAVNVTTPIDIPQLVAGDSRSWSFRFTNGATLESWSGDETYSLRVGIGPLGKNPTLGSFTISGDGATLAGTTDAIPANATPADVFSAITNPATGLSIVSSGVKLSGDTVALSGSSAEYILDFQGALAATAIPLLASNAVNLSPSSAATFFSLRTGSAGVNARQSLRVRQLPYAFQDTWGSASGAWTGTLSTNTEAIVNALGNEPCISIPMEVEVTDPDGNQSTYFQGSITIKNEVIDDNALVPVPLPDYYTASQTDALLAANLDEAKDYTDAAIAAIPEGAFQSLTTIGNSGAATLTSGILNIPTPTAAGLGAALDNAVVKLAGNQVITGTKSFTGTLDMTGGTLLLNDNQLPAEKINGLVAALNGKQDALDTVTAAPATNAATGTKGKRIYAAGFIYECIATNSWIRYSASNNFTNV